MSTFRTTDGSGLKATYTINQGDDLEDTITVFNGLYAVDVSGWHAWFTVKMQANDPREVALIAYDWVPTEIEGVNGQLVIRVSNEETRNLPIGSWPMDLKAITDTGKEMTVMKGQFEVEPSPSDLDH